jgi:hypothetical protein
LETQSFSKYLYPSGRIAVLATELLGKSGAERLDRAKDLDDFISMLGSTYLRELASHLREEKEGEEAFAKERANLVNFIRELALDPRLGDMLSLKDKYLRLKIAAKARVGLLPYSEEVPQEEIAEALELYSELKDPKVIDLALEKRWVEELSVMAQGEERLVRIVSLIRELYDARVRAFSKYLGKEALLERLGFSVSGKYDLELDGIDYRISSIFLEELEKEKYEPYGVGVVALYTYRRVAELRIVRSIWLKKLLGVKT